MIVADMEATGLDHQKHSIVSIGAIEFENPTNQFYMECRPWEGAEIDDEGIAVAGFTREELKDESKPTLEEMITAFYEWTKTCEEKTLMGQNVSSDRQMINAAFGKAGISWNFAYRNVDLHSIVYFHHMQRGIPVPQENDRSALNLDVIARYVGIPDRGEGSHNGLWDAKLEAEALGRVLNGKYLLEDFKEYPVPKDLIQQ